MEPPANPQQPKPPSFEGFPEGGGELVAVPEILIRDLLPEIDHLGELKLTLYVFWRLEQLEGHFRSFRRQDFLADGRFMAGLNADARQAAKTLDEALERAVGRGTLLRLTGSDDQAIYFLNSARGRAAAEAFGRGDWRPGMGEMEPFISPPVPNIFRLYEENIGPLTPLIADALHEAEAIYPHDWILEAIGIAVKNNARSWRYVEAILERWQNEGRDERKDRRDAEKTRRRYTE